MGFHRKEIGLTFARIERKTPVLRPALQSNQSSLCSIDSSRDRGGPNDQVVSVKGAADGIGQRRRRSLMKREKSTGIRTDPRGTP